MFENWQYYNFRFREERECKGLTFCPTKCPRTTILSFSEGAQEGAQMAAKFSFAIAEIYFGFLINQTLEVSQVENQAGKGKTFTEN